jgi:2-iminobutanoate/2-iminopropanoate deaminase
MASKEEVFAPGKGPSEGPYSVAIKSGGFAFISGHGPVDGGKVVEGTIEEQTQYVLDQLDKMLIECGCTRDDVVKSTVHLLDITTFDRFNKVYCAYFANKPRPARTTVQSVLWNDIKVEIDFVAKLPE